METQTMCQDHRFPAAPMTQSTFSYSGFQLYSNNSRTPMSGCSIMGPPCPHGPHPVHLLHPILCSATRSAAVLTMQMLYDEWKGWCVSSSSARSSSPKAGKMMKGKPLSEHVSTAHPKGMEIISQTCSCQECIFPLPEITCAKSEPQMKDPQNLSLEAKP